MLYQRSAFVIGFDYKNKERSIKLFQKYQVNVGDFQGSILGPKLVLLFFDDLSDDVICNIAMNAYNTTLSKCD